MDSIIYLVNCLIKQIDSIIYLVYCFIKQLDSIIYLDSIILLIVY